MGRLRNTHRVTRHRPCPICERPDWCLVSRDGRYAICMRTHSARPARGACGGWIHRLDSEVAATWTAEAEDVRAVSEVRPASSARRDSVYRNLLALSPLVESHRSALLRRKFTPARIAALHYGTLGGPGRAKTCRRLTKAGLSLSGVPGFYLKPGSHGLYWSLAGCSGLLIPCRAPDGRIRGVRIRPDDPGHGGKYRWLSSNGKPGGIGSGVHCHVARPAEGEAEPGTLWVVEGEIKADLAAGWLSSTVVSIPGVGCWSCALADVLELQPHGGRVVVALDSDWESKPTVHEAAWGLSQSCRALGFEVEVATWDVTHKGLDDALAAGARPDRSAKLPQPPWRSRLRSRVLAAAPRRPGPRVISLDDMRARLVEILAETFRSS